MSKVTSFQDIIALWPTLDALAKDIGCSKQAVHQWRDKEVIPRQRWAALLELPQAREVGVTAELLAEWEEDTGSTRARAKALRALPKALREENARMMAQLRALPKAQRQEEARRRALQLAQARAQRQEARRFRSTDAAQRVVHKVIEALGGPKAVAKAAGVGVTAVSNWKALGKIPTKYFLILSERPTKRGIALDPAAFGFLDVPEQVEQAVTRDWLLVTE